MVEVLEKGNVRKGGTQSKYSMVNISWMCQIWTSAVKLGQVLEFTLIIRGSWWTLESVGHVVYKSNLSHEIIFKP